MFEVSNNIKWNMFPVKLLQLYINHESFSLKMHSPENY
jgi:hypothetical protein